MSNANHIRIASYLRDELDDQQREAFLEDLDSNAQLKAEFLLEQAIFNQLSTQDWQEASKDHPDFNSYKQAANSPEISRLKTLLNQQQKSQKVRQLTHTNRKWFLRAAAAIFVGLIALAILLNQSVDNQTLYAQYLDLEAIPALAERGDGTQTALLDIETLFLNQEYSNMLSSLSEHPEYLQDHAVVQIYAGVAYMETNQFEQALLQFNGLINSDLLDAQRGYWYKALVHLKANQLLKAKSQLEYIVDNSLYNAQQAAELLKEL